jgi:type IV secretory pathway VirB3-like protein
MSNPLAEEVRRFKKLGLDYGKVIIGGMLLSGIFLFLYAGIRANYVSIVVLTTVVSTISLSLVMLLFFVRFHEKRRASAERNKTNDEELRRVIIEAVARFSSSETKAFQRSTVLVSVFQWGQLIGKLFYYGLTLGKLHSSFSKGPKKA